MRCLAWFAAPAFGAMAALAVVMSGPVAADEASEKAARELVTAMGGSREVTTFINRMKETMAKDMAEREPSKAAEFASFLDKEASPDSERVKALLADIENAAVAFYAEHFTAEELAEITAFERSAAGQKFTQLTPQLAAVVPPKVIAFQKKLIDDLQVATNQPQWPAPKNSP